MSEYTRRVVEEELRNKLDELQLELTTARKELEVERELRKGAEGDLQAVKHDRDLQEKQIKDLQAEIEEEKRRGKAATINGAKMAAKCDAIEGMCSAYKKAFEVVLEELYGDDDDDD